MSRRFAPPRRISALSVAITLFAAPIAAAQSPDAAPPNTTLLSHAAFVRLVQPPAADVASGPVVADSPRPSLLRQINAAVTRLPPAAPTKAPKQQSWGSRHAKAIVVSSLIGGAVALSLTAWWIATDHFCC